MLIAAFVFVVGCLLRVCCLCVVVYCVVSGWLLVIG